MVTGWWLKQKLAQRFAAISCTHHHPSTHRAESKVKGVDLLLYVFYYGVYDLWYDKIPLIDLKYMNFLKNYAHSPFFGY